MHYQRIGAVVAKLLEAIGLSHRILTVKITAM